MLNTLHSLYKVILSKCELYIWNKLQFSSDNVNNTLRGQSASKQGEARLGWNDGRSPSADGCRLEGSRGHLS